MLSSALFLVINLALQTHMVYYGANPHLSTSPLVTERQFRVLKADRSIWEMCYRKTMTNNRAACKRSYKLHYAQETAMLD